MKKLLISLFSVCILSCTAACDKPTSAPGHDESEHAGHGFEPGGHDDWCGEHQVQESLCTRCNGSLVAGFKATGDWCEKHKVPESQCLACNPDLKIERPPKKETK